MGSASNTNSQVQTNSKIVILPFSLREEEQTLNLFLNVQKVVRVEEFEGLEKLPESMKPFSYTFKYQGLPVPVLDIKKYLTGQAFSSQSCTQKTLQPRLIIVNIQSILYGILVDQTRKVKSISNTHIDPCPSSFDGIKGAYFSAVINEEDGFRYQLDLEQLLDDLDISLNVMRSDHQIDPLLKDKKILVVEDSKLFQKLARDGLTAHGCKVEIADDGLQGLEILSNRAKEFDLVLVDIEMPKMNGIEMIRNFKSDSNSDLPILFHSSISNPTLVEDIGNEGLGEYLVKFEEDQIFNKIKRMLS